jgi:hypothetical protein
MDARPNVQIRSAHLACFDATVVSRLVKEYLLLTEQEKAHWVGTPFTGSDLPRCYVEEVDDPARAYERANVLLAELDDSPVGV